MLLYRKQAMCFIQLGIPTAKCLLKPGEKLPYFKAMTKNHLKFRIFPQ